MGVTSLGFAVCLGSKKLVAKLGQLWSEQKAQPSCFKRRQEERKESSLCYCYEAKLLEVFTCSTSSNFGKAEAA